MTTQSKIIELIELADSYSSKTSEEEREEAYSRNEIDDAMEGRSIPDTLIEMYSYHKTIQFINLAKQFIPGWYFVDLYHITTIIDIKNEGRQSMIDEYHGGNEQLYIESLSSDFIFDWQPDMIPFLEDGSGNFVCVRTLPEDRSVWVIYHDTNDSKIVNANFDLFVLSRIEFYRQGAYFKNSYGELELNWELSQAILIQIDPETECDYMV
jgi:cell wall assembly regulator SMI1